MASRNRELCLPQINKIVCEHKNCHVIAICFYCSLYWHYTAFICILSCGYVYIAAQGGWLHERPLTSQML